jgi:hypothetical protein
MEASGVANLTHEGDIRHDTRDGDLDDKVASLKEGGSVTVAASTNKGKERAAGNGAGVPVSVSDIVSAVNEAAKDGMIVPLPVAQRLLVRQGLQQETQSALVSALSSTAPDISFPLLDRLLEDLPEVVERFVLPVLDPTALALLARVGRRWNAVVMSSGLPCAGITERGCRFRVAEFCGTVERLAWAKANGCPWSARTCALAARGGRIEVLMWAWKHHCPWNEQTCASAAEGGHLDVLMWAREHGCPWDSNTCASAAEGGHLGVLMWARDHDCLWDEQTCASAAEGGHLDVLMWARGHHCPWDDRTCEAAALGGHLDVLIWARDHDCPWDEATCASAARGGHLDVLMWAREHHCPWDSGTCASAASEGHLDVIKWAREHDCPWDVNTCMCASMWGPLEVLRWAIEHGAPVIPFHSQWYEHLLRGEPHAEDHLRTFALAAVVDEGSKSRIK